MATKTITAKETGTRQPDDFIIKILAAELSAGEHQILGAVGLIDAGNTIPFIARYRKEATGGLDDTQLRRLYDRLTYLRGLENRRAEVLALIGGQDKLTPQIEEAIAAAVTLVELEDIYRPFKPRRKTRASVARERGLEQLALMLLIQQPDYGKPVEEIAAEFVSEELGVPTARDALDGACDILAEDISDNPEYRREIRDMTREFGEILSRRASGGDAETVYSRYYDYKERVKTIPPHRYLALNRGENEGILKVSIEIASEVILNYLTAQLLEPQESPARKYVVRAAADGYDRLIAPSVEREIRAELFDAASEGAIGLFSVNLKNLLMSAPLKGKTVLGLDPGYRTGCKLAVVDKTGRVLDTAVIFPVKPFEKIEESKKTVKRLIRTYNVEVIAIGNGTASGESEIFVADVLREIPQEVKYAVVSEAGASVYSASELGAEEFPDFDATQRSAVSIARRLQDPLAELVKIDPKSIGVGQYQHDMKPQRLGAALDGVVEDCVNSVGADLNTASWPLLSRIAGINSTAAKNIVKFREEKGEFRSRVQLTKVPRVGERAFEQCAGFLRVPGSDEVLDTTGVHPESYPAARALLDMFGYSADDVRGGTLGELRSKIARAGGMAGVAEKLGIGEPTLLDITAELEKPGRDVRDSLPQPELRGDVINIEDLTPDMVLPGVVRNVTDFGAFVDIGVHQDGLVHISEISDKFIKHPTEVLAAGQQVRVRILSVDSARGRVALSMKLK